MCGIGADIETGRLSGELREARVAGCGLLLPGEAFPGSLTPERCPKMAVPAVKLPDPTEKVPDPAVKLPVADPAVTDATDAGAGGATLCASPIIGPPTFGVPPVGIVGVATGLSVGTELVCFLPNDLSFSGA